MKRKKQEKRVRVIVFPSTTTIDGKRFVMRQLMLSPEFADLFDVVAIEDDSGKYEVKKVPDLAEVFAIRVKKP